MAKFYKVGGCVRNKLLNIPIEDIDYCVEAESYEHMRNAILEKGIKIIYEMEKFFIIKGKYKDQMVDFVLCRQDSKYYNNRYPENVQKADLANDLSRRDFTINAIAEDENNNLIDPFGGINDIEHKIIRCVISSERLKEDALRILRAIRFYITLEGFELDAEIEKLLYESETINLLDNISNEKIRQELDKCFKHDTFKSICTFNKFPLLNKKLFQNMNLWLKPVFKYI